jgi:hypothetical protein
MIVTIRTGKGSGLVPIVECEMSRKFFGGAAGAFGLAADVARHFAWYLTYQIDGRPRQRP